MKYKIEITRIEDPRIIKVNRWKPNNVNNIGFFNSYKCVEENEKVVDETTVLIQEVADLDLAKVIKAINNI